MRKGWFFFVPLAAALEAASAPVAFEVHDGYFVSNQFERDAAVSYVVLRSALEFDQVFGVAMVMRDKSHRLVPNAFAQRMVAAVIHRGPAVVTYDVASVTREQDTLVVKYTTQTAPKASATFACPLIISVDKWDYRTVEFVEDGKPVRKVVLQKQADFRIECQEAGTLTVTREGNDAILAIKGGRGIGRATISCAGEQWPSRIVLRAYLAGLEKLVLANGEVLLSAAVSSHDNHQSTLRLAKNGKEVSPLPPEGEGALALKTFDAAGKQVTGLPPKGGWFELVIPPLLLTNAPELQLEWVDFYR